MTVYSPINPDGKPTCCPQQHMEQIAGLCDACGQHARLFPIAEGPICGPAAICADCIWNLTPRDLHLGQPLVAAAQREIENRPLGRGVSVRIPAPFKPLSPHMAITQGPEQVCEQQLAFDFAAPSSEQSQPAEKTTPPGIIGTQPSAQSIAHPGLVQGSPAADLDAAATPISNSNDGIPCDKCGQRIRIYLDNAVISRSGVRCCLDCFEAEHDLEPFIVTAAWLDVHGAELDQDWRFVHDIAELRPNSIS